MTQPVVLDMDVITAVEVDGTWYPVAPGTMFATNNPQLRDPNNPDGPPLTPGGLWIWFTGTDGQPYGFRSDKLGMCKWTGLPAQGAAAMGGQGTAGGTPTL